MAANDTSGLFTDGSCDWSQGCDSLKTPTEQSPTNPNGLTRQQLAWLCNGTVRSGGIEPRDGWVYRGSVISSTSLSYLLGSQFQGKATYVPTTGNPYEIWVVGGHVLRVDPTFQTAPIDLSIIYALEFVSITTKANFEQAVRWLVIQSGNYDPETGNGDLPLIWDGSTLKRSNGITGVLVNGQSTGNQFIIGLLASFTIPAATGTIFTLPIAASYGGNQYDKITITSSSGTKLGTFEVMTNSQSNFQVKYTAVASPNQSGNTFASGNYIFAYAQSIVTTTQNVVLDYNTATLAASQYIPTFFFNTPFQLQFTAIPAWFYSLVPGTMLDVYVGSTHLGQLQFSGIVSFPIGPLGVGLVSTMNTLTGGGYNVSGQTFSFIPQLVVPAYGNTISIPITSATPDVYIGNIGDSITIAGLGAFRVTGYGALPSWQAGVGLILTNLSAGPGGFFPVALPPSTAFVITIAFTPSFTGTNINQIPAATAMKYYEGRLWYMQGQTVSAGDIIGGPSGTLANNFQDSVLCVTENPLCFGGDGFTMPAGFENLTGFAIPQMINASLGQGLLNIGSPNWVFSLYVPVSRTDWIAASATNQPQINVIQSGTATGFVNDWDVCPINGDLWYTASDASIHSLLTAVRYFQQWANPILSSNEDDVLSVVNTTLLNWSSSVYFNTRRLGLTLPNQTPFGVVFPAIVPLDLTTISTLETQDPPNWEGDWEGLNILKIDVATFGNKQRCFASVLSSEVPGQMDIWELVIGQIGDQSATQNKRIQWQATLCSFTAGNEFQFKELQGCELWLDEIQGVVDIEIEYRPDGSSCFYKWAAFSVCNAMDSSQVPGAAAYPLVTFQSGVRKPLHLPHPPDADNSDNNRPAYYAYEFQPRITVRGQCRIRGIRLYMTERKISMYENMIDVARNFKSFFSNLLGL